MTISTDPGSGILTDPGSRYLDGSRFRDLGGSRIRDLDGSRIRDLDDLDGSRIRDFMDTGSGILTDPGSGNLDGSRTRDLGGSRIRDLGGSRIRDLDGAGSGISYCLFQTLCPVLSGSRPERFWEKCYRRIMFLFVGRGCARTYLFAHWSFPSGSIPNKRALRDLHLRRGIRDYRKIIARESSLAHTTVTQRIAKCSQSAFTVSTVTDTGRVNNS